MGGLIALQIVGGLIYGIVVFCLYAYMFKKREKQAFSALKKGIVQFFNRLPMILAIFLLIGLFDVFVPKEVVSSVVGGGRGIISVILSVFVGAVMMGPVATSYPLGAMLLCKGAAVSAVAAFLYSWVMLGITVVPFEISVFGSRFALVRNVFAFIGAVVMGLLTSLVLTGGLF